MAKAPKNAVARMQRMERTKTTPIATTRSMRMHTARGITSMPAGKMTPIAAVPLLREDQINSGRLRFTFEMMETAELLMNAVNVRVMAYLVPTLALDRFDGMDTLNRSYEGVGVDGAEPVPYIELQEFGAHGANEVYTYLGMHGRPTQMVNTMYLEAYNQIWNFRAKNRSPDLELRDRLATDLAPAFWQHEQFKHIVPDFDQAVIDGEVPLNITESRIPVRGIGALDTMAAANGGQVRETGGDLVTYPAFANSEMRIRATQPGFDGVVDVFAEMQENGITVSLSNIELARKTAAFAKLRGQFTGHSDEYIINLLMDGITVPEQAFRQPMLIGEKQTIFGMSKRYATDSGNLTESAVNGATFIDMSIQLPRIPVGGVVMIVAEVTPEQLFERQKDPFLHAQNVDDFPHYLRDTLDPEKVAVVPNEYVDIDHATPDATFGYAPLNYQWNVTAPRIGGRYYRPEVDEGFDEDRQRIWAVETQNPTLSTDFYLCTNIHQKPFMVTTQDPFEVVTSGDFYISGNTVFGSALVEASTDYEDVMAEAPQERIQKPVNEA